MLVRLLFLLLIALNVGVAAWLTFGPTQHHQVPATAPGVPELQLLSEAPPEPADQAPAPPVSVDNPAADTSVATSVAKATASSPSTAAPAAPGTPAPTASAPQCLRIGPFDTQADTRQLLSELSGVQRSRTQQSQADQFTGWWVYLPAFPSREQALVEARQLAAKGVHDYYVVTAGDRLNTVSLGLFHDKDNAIHRRDRIIALGFKPLMKARTETLPQFWLDVVFKPGATLDWKAHVGDPDVQAKPLPCF
ncbi:SPOR domain-containing protein [Oleiagrimonas sp. C23AA]|uniref:SPOR domain-containing protein n=1 Tax=Oleiagrimonas sp. C23AA TaxID=2719047 RepID=UPI001421241C|nr:SPOR domain-containing protein [Oleiagrimonas sp. C23AA]NII11874.1 SPOR domain-containing protein [Oleiagrimonas sp. C23AA]